MEEYWYLILSLFASPVISTITAFTVNSIKNKHDLKIKKIDVDEKHNDDIRKLEEERKAKTREILTSYLSATGKFISSPSYESEAAFGEVKGIVFIYAPSSTHKTIERLNELLEDYSPAEWNKFFNKRTIANSLLTELSKCFAVFLKEQDSEKQE